MFVLKSMVTATIMMFILFIFAVFDISIFPGVLIHQNQVITHELISLKSVIVFEKGHISDTTIFFSSMITLIFSIIIAHFCVKLIFKK